jgi:uncharacterized damage-inducible protein DinB
MRKHTLATIVLLSVLVASSAFGASIAADLQRSWAQQKGLLLMTAKAMPAESFDFRPTPEQRSFGEQLLHVAGANSFLMSFTDADSEGLAIDTDDLSTFGLQADGKDEILAVLEESFDRGTAALAEFDDEAMLAEVQGPPWVGQVTRAGMVTFILGHNMDIYGQMAVYLRLQGVVPPASRR